MLTRHNSFEDKTVTDDDHDAFRAAFSDATPLKVEDRVPETRPKPKPGAHFSRADERDVLRESLQDDIDTIEHGHGNVQVLRVARFRSRSGADQRDSSNEQAGGQARSGVGHAHPSGDRVLHTRLRLKVSSQ